MSPFVEGLLAGYGIAIPVGAIAVLIISTGMRCGFRTGFMAGAGAATADVIYAALASVAGAAIMLVLTPIAGPLRIASGAVLVGMACFGMWQGYASIEKKSSSMGACDPIRTYAQFIGITILNPMTVIYFTALILGRDYSAASLPALSHLLFIAGAGLASLSWQTLLAWLGGVAHRRLSRRLRMGAILLGNLVVLIFGLRILWLALLVNQ